MSATIIMDDDRTWADDHGEREAPPVSEMPPADMARIELLERVRSAANAYVNAPTKFGIRYQAYRQLVKALEESEI